MKIDIKAPLIKSVLLTTIVAGCLFMYFRNTSHGENSQALDGKLWDGERWFGMQHCDGCHGKDGLGGEQAPEIPHLELSYQELLSKIRKSKSLTMPSYPNRYLSDQEVADICSYLQDETRLPATGAGNVAKKTE